MRVRIAYFFLLLCFVFPSCEPTGTTAEKQASSSSPDHTFFELLAADKTGIDFVNEVADRNDFNILTYRNFYNGGGVSIGDINNDQLPDL